MNILELPEDCLTHILSLASPRDVVRSSAVSKQFLSLSTLDTVWDNFLPSDVDVIISKSSSVIPHGSRKELFMHLCDFPILLENNTKSFGLDKRSGKICYMLGSRALSIIWGSSPQYWRWTSVRGSRFPECAVLIDVCWLEINGKIDTTLLSRGTLYGVYFVFKIKVGVYTGFGETFVKGSVSVISEDGLPILGDQQTIEIKSFSLVAPRLDIESDSTDRESGWMICDARFRESEEEDEEESQDKESEEEHYLRELFVTQDEESEEDGKEDEEYSSREVLVTQHVESEEEELESRAEESEEEDEEESQNKESEDEDEEEGQDEEGEEVDTEVSHGELLVTREESEEGSVEESKEEYSTRELLVTQDDESEEQDGEEDEEYSSREVLVTQHVESEEDDEEESLGELPVARDDEWMEIELGRYQVSVNDGDERVVLVMSLKEVENLNWKNGLAVHGIEIRPLS